MDNFGGKRKYRQYVKKQEKDKENENKRCKFDRAEYTALFDLFFSSATSQSKEYFELLGKQAQHSEIHTLYESVQEVQTKHNLEHKSIEQIRQELFHAEKELNTLKSERDQLQINIQKDYDETLDIKRKMKIIEKETMSIKAEIEKLKKDGKQQKEFLAINKNQLAAAEEEKEKIFKTLKSFEDKALSSQDIPAISPFDFAKEFPTLEEIEDSATPMLFEQAEKLVTMLNSGSKILVSGDKALVRGDDLATLKKQGWLNDEVINFYVELILKRTASNPEKYPKIHMFNTFFYPLLERKGYSGVASITKKGKIDIFSLDLVIVPIHLHNHWALAVINIKERRLEYYDSMSKGYNNSVLSSLKYYVEEEYKDKKKVSSYDMSGWKYYRVKNLPQQTNTYDCGVFAMTFAEHISRGASVLFVSPKHMEYFRLKMMWEIINSNLLPVG